MQILPVRRYEIKSLAKPSEIAAILSPHVEPYALFPGRGQHRTFSGAVSETGFRFVHIGASGKTFPFHPTISGRFIPSAQRTTIRITIKHDAFFYTGGCHIRSLLLDQSSNGWRITFRRPF